MHVVTKVVVGLLVAVGSATYCMAASVPFQASLAPASEVPGVSDTGSGKVDAKLDTTTHVLSYKVVFSGFSTPVTMAHFHGPATTTANAGVQVALGNNPVSPMTGSVTLTPAQQDQLLSGMWYANVHTAQHPKGAARGQLTKLN